jgi:type I restriction enzyme, S subunit
MNNIKDSNVLFLSLDYKKLYNFENRLDGSFYCNEDNILLNNFEKNKFKKKKLINYLRLQNNWKDKIYLPNRSSRTYVKKKFGIPYFSGSDITMSFPKPSAYLSKNHKSVKSTLLKKNYILVAARGTIGNSTLTSNRLHNSCASDNIIRVIASEEQKYGYLYAFLKSKFGKAQFKRDTYGAVVDAISPTHVANIEVPVINSKDINKINKDIKDMISIREKGYFLLDKANNLFMEELNLDSFDDLSSDLRITSINSFGFETRFDGSFHDPIVNKVYENFNKSKNRIIRIGDEKISEKIFMPGRFSRIFVKEKFGIPFLTGKNILQSDSVERRYLIKNKKSEEYKIKKGWLLLTRSGTIGRASLVTSEWDNWTATEDVIRIIPNNKNVDSGYFLTFINSIYGQLQINKHVHGSVIDHITEPQVAEILMPYPKIEIQKKIGKLSTIGSDLIIKANFLEKKIITFLEKKLN